LAIVKSISRRCSEGNCFALTNRGHEFASPMKRAPLIHTATTSNRGISIIWILFVSRRRIGCSTTAVSGDRSKGAM
jgi:hypothetical protein